MKALKTSFFFILAALIFGFAFACKKPDPHKIIKDVELKFAQGETKDTVKSDFTVPTKIDKFKIKWQSSNDKVVQIDEDGKVLVARQDNDETVNLTAQIEDAKKTFTITVLKKDGTQPTPDPEGNKVDKAEFDKTIADGERLAALDFINKAPEMVEKDKEYVRTSTDKNKFVARLNALKAADSQNLSKNELKEYNILKSQVTQNLAKIATGTRQDGYISNSQAQKVLASAKSYLAMTWSDKDASEFDEGTKYIKAADAKKQELDTLYKTVSKYTFDRVPTNEEKAKYEELKSKLDEVKKLATEGTKKLEDGKNITADVSATVKNAIQLTQLEWISRIPSEVKKDKQYVHASQKRLNELKAQIKDIQEKLNDHKFDMASKELQAEFNNFKALVQKYQNLVKTGEQISLKDTAEQVLEKAKEIKDLPFENKEPDQVSGKYVKADQAKRTEFNDAYNPVAKVKLEKWEEGYTKQQAEQLEALKKLVEELVKLIAQGTKPEDPNSMKLTKHYDFTKSPAGSGYKVRTQKVKNQITGSDDTLKFKGVSASSGKTGFTVAKNDNDTFSYIEMELGKTASKSKIEFFMEKWTNKTGTNKFQKLEIQYRVNGEWKTAKEITDINEFNGKTYSLEIGESTDALRLKLSATEKPKDNSHHRFNIKEIKIYY